MRVAQKTSQISVLDQLRNDQVILKLQCKHTSKKTTTVLYILNKLIQFNNKNVFLGLTIFGNNMSLEKKTALKVN